jgi:hypothetical protein
MLGGKSMIQTFFYPCRISSGTIYFNKQMVQLKVIKEGNTQFSYDFCMLLEYCSSEYLLNTHTKGTFEENSTMASLVRAFVDSSVICPFTLAKGKGREFTCLACVSLL